MITINGSSIAWEGGVLSHPLNNDDNGLTKPIVISGRMPLPSEWFAILAEVFSMANHSYTQGYVEVLPNPDNPPLPFPPVGTKGIALIYSDGVAVMYFGPRFWWLIPSTWKLLPEG